MPISIHLRTTPPSPPTVSASVPRAESTKQCRAFERHPQDTGRAERRLGDSVPERSREQPRTFSGPRDAAAQRRRERSPPTQRSICAANSAPRPHHTAKAQRQARAYASTLCKGGISARTGVPPGPQPACKGPRQGPRLMPPPASACRATASKGIRGVRERRDIFVTLGTATRCRAVPAHTPRPPCLAPAGPRLPDPPGLFEVPVYGKEKKRRTSREANGNRARPSLAAPAE